MLIYPVLAGSVDLEGNDELVRTFKTYKSASDYALSEAHNEAVEMTNDSSRTHMVSSTVADLDNEARITVHDTGVGSECASSWWVIQEMELLD